MLGDAQCAVGAKKQCLVLPICFVLSWFMCAINITHREKKIVAENRDINSKLKNRDSYFSLNRAGLIQSLSPPLFSGMTRADFQTSGNKPEVMERLKM